MKAQWQVTTGNEFEITAIAQKLQLLTNFWLHIFVFGV
jgi:hypothetical protein